MCRSTWQDFSIPHSAAPSVSHGRSAISTPAARIRCGTDVRPVLANPGDRDDGQPLQSLPGGSLPRRTSAIGADDQPTAWLEPAAVRIRVRLTAPAPGRHATGATITSASHLPTAKAAVEPELQKAHSEGRGRVSRSASCCTRPPVTARNIVVNPALSRRIPVSLGTSGCVVRPEGIEPPTSGLGNRCSIRLSYGRLDVHVTLRRARANPCHCWRRMKPRRSADSFARSGLLTYIMCPDW